MRIRHLCGHNWNSISICELEILLLFPNLDLILIWGRPRTPFCRQNRPQGQVKLPPLLGFISIWFLWYLWYSWGILVVFCLYFGGIWLYFWWCLGKVKLPWLLSAHTSNTFPIDWIGFRSYTKTCFEKFCLFQRFVPMLSLPYKYVMFFHKATFFTPIICSLNFY